MKKLYKNIISVAAAAVFMLQPVAAATSLGGDLHTSVIEVGLNAELSSYAFWQTSNDRRQQEYYLEVKPNETAMPVVAYGNKLYGKSTISAIGKYLTDNGYHPVAGINADFFSFETGLPLGIVITDGIVRSSDTGGYAIGFDKDGNSFIGKPQLSITATVIEQPVTENADPENPDSPSDPENPDQPLPTVKIDYINKLRQPYSVYMLTSDFSTSTRNKTAGVDVILRIRDGSLSIGGELTAVVESITPYDSSIAITDDMIVLTCDATGPVSRFDAFASGQVVKINITAGDARFQSAVSAVGGGELLVENGEVTSGLTGSAAPRTAVGVKSDGTLVMYVNDGRKTSYSTGLSMTALATRMKELDCEIALNFDGGGSTAISAEYPGSSSLQVINTPSEGSLRTCANYLFIVNTSVPTGYVRKLFPYPYDSLMMRGSKTSYSVLATDNNYTASYLAEVPEYSLSDDSMGTVSAAGVFTAGDKLGTLNVKVSTEAAEGSATVTIVDPQEIVIKDEKSGNSLSSLSIAPGGATNLTVTPYYNTYILKSDDSLFTWSVTGGIGTVDQNGTFTATSQTGAKGKITVSYGSLSTSVDVSVGKEYIVLESFEFSDYTAIQQGEECVLTEQSNTDYVKYGKRSAALSYSIPAAAKDESDKTGNTLIPSFSAAALPLLISDGAKYLSLYVYGNQSGAELYLNLSTGSGSSQLSLGTVDFSGYKRLSVALPSGTTGITGIGVKNKSGQAISGTLYIDQVQTSHEVFTDETPPTIKIETSTALIGAASITFTAKITDNADPVLSPSNIALLRDGAPVEFEFDSDTGLLMALIPNFEDLKLHRITVQAKDKSGNIQRVSVDYNQGKSVISSFADTGSHFSNEYANYLFDREILEGSLENGKRYFYPDNAMSRQEFAKIMSNFMGLDEAMYQNVELPYSDLSAIADWALPYVKAMYATGIIRGKNMGNGVLAYDPQGVVTRAELLTIVGRNEERGFSSEALLFSDAASIPGYALGYVQTLVARKVLAGYDDNTFRPNRAVTRGEMAKIFYNLY